jgi:hypothetical protein
MPLLLLSGMISFSLAEDVAAPQTAEELQALIDKTPAYGTIVCDRNRELTVSTTIRVRKPLTIRGLVARLPDKLGKTRLLVVESEGVTVTDFALRGNADTVEQSDRASLLVFHAGNFRVENGRFDNVSQNGLTIEPSKTDDQPRDVVGGVVRNLVGDGVIRDVVSITSGEVRAVVRDIVVENVRAYRSRLRGAVEVSDGSQHITVRNVYAEETVYAVDIQDHNNPKHVNFHVLIDNITAVRCRHAVRFNVQDYGHHDITLANITAVDTEQPLHIRHTSRLTVSNVSILGSGEKHHPVSVTNSHGVVLRDVYVENVPHAEHLIEIDAQSDHVLVDGVISRDVGEKLQSAVRFENPSAAAASFVEVRNVLAGKARTAPANTDSTKDAAARE